MNEQQAVTLANAAEVLCELSTELERLGAKLCGDDGLAARFIHQLQAIDLIAQKQRSLATVLRAECRQQAVAEIGLEELGARLATTVTGG